MNKLTSYQISNAFPDEAIDLIPKVLVALNFKVLKYDAHIYKLRQMGLSKDDLKLAIMIAESQKPTETIERFKVYNKTMEILRSKEESINIDKAKQVKIQDLISSPVKPFGNKLKCSCPFHEDNTPSFFIYPENNSFYCFSCNAGGDVIEFYMQKNKVNFLTAIKELT